MSDFFHWVLGVLNLCCEMKDWPCDLVLKRRMAVGLCFTLTAMSLGAQSNHELGIEGLGAVKHFEITYGLNQSNLSLLRGVVIDTKLEPTLDLKLETEQGFFSLACPSITCSGDTKMQIGTTRGREIEVAVLISSPLLSGSPWWMR